jgi:hypothetical protein
MKQKIILETRHDGRTIDARHSRRDNERPSRNLRLLLLRHEVIQLNRWKRSVR